MKLAFCSLLIVLSAHLLSGNLNVQAAPRQDGPVRRLPVTEFRDKMKGAWIGQMIGVGWGMPTEFKIKGEIIPEDKMPPWKPDMVNQYNNDAFSKLPMLDNRKSANRGLKPCQQPC